MSYMPHLRNFRLPDVDQGIIVQDQVTYFSVIDLPFRLRLGRYFRKPISPDATEEIVCLNRVHLPKSSGYKIESLPFVKDRRLLNTRLLVIENAVALTVEEIEGIRQADPFPPTTQSSHLLKQQPGPQFLYFSNPDKSLSAIQRFIELYHLHCPPQYSGDMVRPLWMSDYFTMGIVFGLCLRPSKLPLPDRFVKTLLRSDNPREEERLLGASFLHDVSPMQKRSFIRSLRDGDEPRLADQLLLLSHFYQQQHNMEMAVVTAVAALEAALYIFAKNRLEPKLEEALTESFLREQGASMLVQALPRLLFSLKNMPEAKIFEGVQQAITARNHIMHGKVDKKTGKPKHLKLGHLGDPIYACKQLLQAFQRES